LIRDIVILHEYQIYKLVTAPNYIEAISSAALAVPKFLRQHPECAADQRERDDLLLNQVRLVFTL
jgi:hypothetical protein